MGTKAADYCTGLVLFKSITLISTGADWFEAVGLVSLGGDSYSEVLDLLRVMRLVSI